MTIHIQLTYQQRIATIWANHLNQTGTIPWTPMCCPAPPHPPTIPERVPGPPCVAQLLPTLQTYLNEFLDAQVSPRSSPLSNHTWTSSLTPMCRPAPLHSPKFPLLLAHWPWIHSLRLGWKTAWQLCWQDPVSRLGDAVTRGKWVKGTEQRMLRYPMAVLARPCATIA